MTTSPACTIAEACRSQRRLGSEPGPLSQWLFSALAEAELPVVCVETRYVVLDPKWPIREADIVMSFDGLVSARGWPNFRGLRARYYSN
jgi:hypothetical protein